VLCRSSERILVQAAASKAFAVHKRGFGPAALDRSDSGAMRSVRVSQVTIALLKGNKEEYY
jgi:hypothetical protein